METEHKELSAVKLTRLTGIIGLIILGMSDIAQGVVCLPVLDIPLPFAIAEMTRKGIPIIVWDILWILSGTGLIATSMAPNKLFRFKFGSRSFRFHLRDIAIIWTIGLYASWGSAYALSYFSVEASPGVTSNYVLGLQYIGGAVIGFSSWMYWVLHRQVIPHAT